MTISEEGVNVNCLLFIRANDAKILFNFLICSDTNIYEVAHDLYGQAELKQNNRS